MVRMVYGVPVIVTPEDGSFAPHRGRSSARELVHKAFVVNSRTNPSARFTPVVDVAQVANCAEPRHLH
jgi:hypothetical protein